MKDNKLKQQNLYFGFKEPHSTRMHFFASGYVNVYSDLMTNKRWNRRWCVVKSGMLACYKEVGDEDAEFSFPLPGCEVASACDLKKKLAFRIIEEGKEKITLDVSLRLPCILPTQF